MAQDDPAPPPTSPIERRNIRTLTASADYLGAADLMLDDGSFREVSLVIAGLAFDESIKNAKGAESLCHIVSFRGARKRWVLNKTNALAFAELHGPWTDEWHGKAVTLYVTKVRSPEGGMVNGIRVRPTVPQPRQPAAPAPADTSGKQPPEVSAAGGSPSGGEPPAGEPPAEQVDTTTGEVLEGLPDEAHDQAPDQNTGHEEVPDTDGEAGPDGLPF